MGSVRQVDPGAESLVVLPTDTVYGIGANPWNHRAVSALLLAKGRDERMPPPIALPDSVWLDRIASFQSDEEQQRARRLAEKFWPGPLTLIVHTRERFGWDLRATGWTVALRVPDHPVALQVLRQSGPLALTSANTTGNPPARSVEEARGYFGDSVGLYVDGGTLKPGPASTILDVTGPDLSILRRGALGLGELQAALKAGSKGQ